MSDLLIDGVPKHEEIEGENEEMYELEDDMLELMGEIGEDDEEGYDDGEYDGEEFIEYIEIEADEHAEFKEDDAAVTTKKRKRRKRDSDDEDDVDDSDDSDDSESKSASLASIVEPVKVEPQVEDLFESSEEEEEYDETNYAITAGPSDFPQLQDVKFDIPFFDIEIEDPYTPKVKSEEDIPALVASESISEISFSEAKEVTLTISRDQLFDKDSLIDIVKSMQMKQSAVAKLNFMLNRATMDFFRKKNLKRMLMEDTSVNQKDLQKRYRSCLEDYRIAMIEQKHYRMESEDKMFVLRKRLCKYHAEKSKNASVLAKSMSEICPHLRSTSTGQPMTEKKLNELINKQEEMRSIMSNIRLHYIKAKNKLQNVNNLTRELEDLGEGLRIADFETISAEVQSLADKIEERNNELAKLRTRCFSDTQKLAHVREKENMLSIKIAERQDDLEYVANLLKETREYCSQLKKKQIALRKEYDKMRDNSALLDKPILLRDFDKTIETIAVLKEEAAQYRAKRDSILEKCAELVKLLFGQKPEETASQKFDNELNCRMRALEQSQVPRIVMSIKPTRDAFKKKTARDILSHRPI